ncbi:hypothetical protein [Streptomyces caatingaensis]|uniref:Uncharacterized protein n=1 Tax=Streptomyces caatingaensis TaxID=1678637 RepID=A0A0K9XHP7_9ACTN|nr:hypothetical protein [Streptomyces caatingaensis]KNB52591.1 hypothetical protein AC230_07950 [Streptomyces caatingaensis]
MADADTQQEARPDARAQREAARLARQIGVFARDHGGGAEVQLAHIGRGRTRIALVGTDGEWGNVVARSYAAAERALELAVAAGAGVEAREEFDGEMAAKVRTGPYEWGRMAGLQLGGRRNPTAAA